MCISRAPLCTVVKSEERYKDNSALTILLDLLERV